jgi:hypothetical protein
MALPRLDRDAYEEQMQAEFERTLREVTDAADDAPQERVIGDSEEQSRDALDRFRKVDDSRMWQTYRTTLNPTKV